MRACRKNSADGTKPRPSFAKVVLPHVDAAYNLARWLVCNTHDALQSADSRRLRDALDELPVTYREVIVLRELEGMSYKEIAEVMGVPIGTVMSGPARGRDQLRERLLRAREKEVQRGVRE